MVNQLVTIPTRLFIRLKSIKPMCRLFYHTQGSLIYKCKSICKYYPIYIHHTLIQQQLLHSNLAHYQHTIQQSNYKSKIHSLYSTYTANILAQINSKKQSFLQQQHTTSRYEKQARNILHHGMEYLSLYYESLQNLIQGRREVMHQQGFLFEDGQSVKQKRLQFEKYLTRLLGRSKEQLQELNENMSQPLQTDYDEKGVK